MKSLNTMKLSLAGLAMLALTAIAPVHADTPNNMDNREDHVNELKNATQGTSESYEADKKAKSNTNRMKHGKNKQPEVGNDKNDPSSMPGPK